MKLGYDLKIKDSFVPNGTPPKVIDIMRTKDNPISVFYNGCYMDEFKLQSPVYQQLHIFETKLMNTKIVNGLCWFCILLFFLIGEIVFCCHNCLGKL